MGYDKNYKSVYENDNLFKQFLRGGRDTVYNTETGATVQTGGYAPMLNFIGSGVSAFMNNKNQDEALAQQQKYQEMMMNFGKANLGMELNNMYNAQNKSSKYAGMAGAINRGGPGMTVDQRNATRDGLNSKFDDKNGVVNRSTGAVTSIPGTDAAMGITPKTASTTVPTGAIKKKTPTSNSAFNNNKIG